MQTLEKQTLPQDKEEVANHFTDLKSPRKAISDKYYKANLGLALLYTFLSFGFYAVTIAFLYYTFVNKLYYLYPLAWLVGGTGVTSLFVLGHDCAHQAFFKNNRWNDFLGHIALSFSFYPYHAWKFSHNAHHKHTNLLHTSTNDVYYDNAWIPLTVKQYKALKKFKPVRAFLYRVSRFFPPLGALVHNFLTHYFLSKFNAAQRKKVYFSYCILALICSSTMAGLYYLTGSIFAILHFFILPGLFFSFWMSTYTYQHHTSTEIKFLPEDKWNPYLGQIQGTYNCLSPKWLSFLHLNIDIHAPHHLSTAIPCYHLRGAYEDLKKSVHAGDILEGKLSFTYYFKQILSCHVWDDKRETYVRFRDI